MHRIFSTLSKIVATTYLSVIYARENRKLYALQIGFKAPPELLVSICKPMNNSKNCDPSHRNIRSVDHGIRSGGKAPSPMVGNTGRYMWWGNWGLVGVPRHRYTRHHVSQPHTAAPLQTRSTPYSDHSSQPPKHWDKFHSESPVTIKQLTHSRYWIYLRNTERSTAKFDIHETRH